MSAILKFDFQKRKQLCFSEVNYLNYLNKDPILHVKTTFSLKQGETRTQSPSVKDGATRRKILAFCENCFCHNLKTNLHF